MEQEKNKNYKQKNKKHNSKQSINRNKQKITKIIQPIYTPTLEQLLMKNNFAISYDLKKVYNYVPVHSTIQNTISGSIIQIPGDLLK
jgi:hypothetical protein